jgi:RNA polymerase sigma factor (sigma-70 family)
VVDVSTVRRTGADAVQIAVANELAERLREAIGRLPPQQSAVFCLRYFHDVSYEDIGESLGIDRGAVATALYKARQNLKSMLGESN